MKFDCSVAFIGDSRTQGFIMYNGLKEVEDYSYIGLMVDTNNQRIYKNKGDPCGKGYRGAGRGAGQRKSAGTGSPCHCPGNPKDRGKRKGS